MLSLLSICGGYAQVVFELNENEPETILPINRLYIFEDTSSSVSFDKIRSSPQLFSRPVNFEPLDYHPESTYWVRLDLKIPTNLSSLWLLEFYDQTIDSIVVYQPTREGYKTLVMGDQMPFEAKHFQHKNFQVPIHRGEDDYQTYYFRIKSHSYADIRVAVRTVNRFVQYALNEYLVYGVFYGMILIIILYNLLIYTAIREIKYLYYTFYIVSVGIYAMCVDGIAYQYIWPNSPGWNQIAYGVALYAVIFWSLMFGQRFLSLRIRAPHLHHLITITLVLRSLWFLYALLVDNSLFDIKNIEIIPLTLIFYSGVYSLIHGYKPARYFVIAYGFLFLGFLIKILVNVSIIPFGIASYYSFHLGFSLEMLFLTFALSDRVRIMKARRDRAMKRIIIQHQENAELKDLMNKELEKRIHLRTLELEEKNRMLEESNQKLFEQTKDINRINSMLDLDNWKLKNNIKEILQDRLINKNLTYEEFVKVFPDKISCFRFLDRLKWRSGYECLKCGNEKFIQGQSKFSRRCTRCGYDESVTSNTVFHRLRFPLEKAFYILYVTNSQQHHYTLDELAEILDLRRNTIWSFRKKIEKIYHKKENKEASQIIQNLFAVHLN
jgi:hypothetical protein